MQKYTQEELISRNLSVLESNNYTIDEILNDADFWFSDLVIPIDKTSRGWKIACKKLADKVRSLQKELEVTKHENKKSNIR